MQIHHNLGSTAHSKVKSNSKRLSKLLHYKLIFMVLEHMMTTKFNHRLIGKVDTLRKVENPGTLIIFCFCLVTLLSQDKNRKNQLQTKLLVLNF